MPPYLKKIPGDSKYIDCQSSPESRMIAEMLGHDTSEQDSEPKAGIP